MNEPLKKITDEKVRDILDKMLGNQQDYMSNILDDLIYKEYREKYDKQYEINKKIYINKARKIPPFRVEYELLSIFT